MPSLSGNSQGHPLVQLLAYYLDGHLDRKSEHADLSPIDYNRNFGLFMDVPEDWPWIDAIVEVNSRALEKGMRNSLIIYPSSEIYSVLGSCLPQDTTSFIPWHQIYTAMMLRAQDERHFQEVRKRINAAHLVVFVGASAAVPKDVLDQVRGMCEEACLIILA